MRRILSVLTIFLSLTAAAVANDGSFMRSAGSAPDSAVSALSTHDLSTDGKAKGKKHDHKQKKHHKHKHHGKKAK